MGYVIAAIPCYNEGPSIGSVVLKAKVYVNEVIVVDDGSTDDTAEVAELAGAHVIRHARNLGKGMAIRSAWLYARERTPDALVLLDGDNQHEPKDIPRLLNPVLEGETDVILGVRWGKTSGMPTYRRIGKRILDYATAAGFKNGMLTDSQCGYRVFSGEALRILEPEESSLGIESQMLVEVQERGLRIQEMNIEARYDVEGSTYPPSRHGFGVLRRMISLVSEKRPLFFFGIPGFVLIILATLLAILTLQLYYSSGTFAIGYAFLVLLFAIIGVVSVFIGIVLNALRRILRK
jgi:glycosyltransferase involved in cell wall biosynthesis